MLRVCKLFGETISKVLVCGCYCVVNVMEIQLLQTYHIAYILGWNQYFPVLTLLDLQLEGDTRCMTDWLEYQREDDMLGHGHKICTQDHADNTYTIPNTVRVNFNANGETEGRGFLIKYEGKKLVKDG